MKVYKDTVAKWALYFTCFIYLTACSSLPQTFIEQQQLSVEERVIFNQKVYDKSWSLVNDKYFDSSFNGKDWIKLGEQFRTEALAAESTYALYSVINNLLSQLEVSHLNAVNVQPFNELFTTGALGTAGFSYQIIENKRVVHSVLLGGPADEAGLQKGWFLVEANGKKYEGDQSSVTERIATTVFSTDGDPISFTFVDYKDQTHIFILHAVSDDRLLPREANKDFDPVEVREMSDGILYLRIKTFRSDKVVKSLQLTLEEHLDVSGLVLDLRGNPGGKLNNFRIALGQFFPENIEFGTTVSRKDKQKENKVFRLRSVDYKGPIVILTNVDTGSAAEVFTHVMQYYKRASVVGRTTAGAVLVSSQFTLPDGGKISIPMHDYIGLDGLRLEGRGVIPDKIVSTPTIDSFRASQDLDLDAAIEILMGR